MKNATATFIGADQNWKDETTVYWFRLNGTDYGTDVDFDSDVYGIAESGPNSSVLNEDGYPLTEGDHETVAVRNAVSVTDDLR